MTGPDLRNIAPGSGHAPEWPAVPIIQYPSIAFGNEAEFIARLRRRDGVIGSVRLVEPNRVGQADNFEAL